MFDGKRWDCEGGRPIENSSIDEFLKEVIEVCKKHGFSIGHEDTQGAFVVCKYNDESAKWLYEAMVSIPNEED